MGGNQYFIWIILLILFIINTRTSPRFFSWYWKQIITNHKLKLSSCKLERRPEQHKWPVGIKQYDALKINLILMKDGKLTILQLFDTLFDGHMVSTNSDTTIKRVFRYYFWLKTFSSFDTLWIRSLKSVCSDISQSEANC